MKLITRDTDYAIRALCAIATRKGKIVSVSQLVRELHVPRPFLRKILQQLKKKGILLSYKGLGGGFQLKSDAERIRLIDLIAIFQDSFSLSECLFKKSRCPNTLTCSLRKKITDLERKMAVDLSRITISSLIRSR